MKGQRNSLTRALIRSKVAVDQTTGCWNCIDCNSHGYGQIKINYKTWRAHRAAWVAFRGQVPSGLYVLHKCDNRSCCNPKHLYLGSNTDNVRDTYTRGRARPVQGAQHGMSKLTDSIVMAIFSRVKDDGWSQVRAATHYGVDSSVVSRIVTGKTWLHLNLVPNSHGRYQRKYADRRAP